MFMHQEQHALILTDSLATTPTGEAFAFRLASPAAVRAVIERAGSLGLEFDD